MPRKAKLKRTSSTFLSISLWAAMGSTLPSQTQSLYPPYRHPRGLQGQPLGMSHHNVGGSIAHHTLHACHVVLHLCRCFSKIVLGNLLFLVDKWDTFLFWSEDPWAGYVFFFPLATISSMSKIKSLWESQSRSFDSHSNLACVVSVTKLHVLLFIFWSSLFWFLISTL